MKTFTNYGLLLLRVTYHILKHSTVFRNILRMAKESFNAEISNIDQNCRLKTITILTKKPGFVTQRTNTCQTSTIKTHRAMNNINATSDFIINF